MLVQVVETGAELLAVDTAGPGRCGIEGPGQGPPENGRPERSRSCQGSKRVSIPVQQLFAHMNGEVFMVAELRILGTEIAVLFQPSSHIEQRAFVGELELDEVRPLVEEHLAQRTMAVRSI